MTNIISIEGHRPHILLINEDENIGQIFPVSLIEDIITGRMRTDEIEEWDRLLRIILTNWLKSLREGASA